MSDVIDFPGRKKPDPVEPGKNLPMAPVETVDGHVHAIRYGAGVCLYMRMGTSVLEGILTPDTALELARQLTNEAYHLQHQAGVHARSVAIRAGSPHVVEWLKRRPGGLAAAENTARRYGKPLAWLIAPGTTPEHVSALGELWVFLHRQSTFAEIGRAFDVPTARVRKWAEAAASRMRTPIGDAAGAEP